MDVAWDPPDTNRVWHLSAWTERKPVPMLEREILERFALALGRCLDEAGSGFGQDSVCFVNGYCYMGTSALTEREVAERRQRHVERCAEIERAGSDVYEAEVRPLLEARLTALRAARRRATDLTRLVAWLDGAIDAATDAMGNWHWRMSPPTPFDWKSSYAEITGRPEAEATVLLQGLGHATSKLVGRLRRLARHLQRDPALIDAAARGDVTVIDSSAAFADEFRRLLRDHGRRTGYGLGSNVNFHTPTWSMRPEMVVELIGGYAKSDLDALEHAERRAKRQRTALARRVRDELSADPERLARFEAAYRRAVDDVRRGENSNHLIEQETMGTMREAVHAVGQFLVDAGALVSADDVYHLTLDELRKSDIASFRAIVDERRTELERLAALEPPVTIGADPPSPSTRRASHPPTASASRDAGDSGAIRGVAVAYGRATGRARIVRATAEPPDVEPGDVLVAADAGPAWTPVFPIIAALVLDGGHIADHAAIMCRDLGIPAVMRTGDATKRLIDGVTVVVDGAEGTVSVSAAER